MALKLIHTADWHLGQTFFGYDREAEHDAFLGFLTNLLVERETDVLLIAGDVFDVTNPSAGAQRRFYRFLKEANRRNPGLQIVIIAGNHDSAIRLEAPNPLLEELNTSIVGIVGRTDSGEIDLASLVVPLRNRAGEREALCLAVPFLRQGDYPAAPEGELDSYVAGIGRMYRRLYAYADARRNPGEAIVAWDTSTLPEPSCRTTTGASAAIMGVWSPYPRIPSTPGSLIRRWGISIRRNGSAGARRYVTPEAASHVVLGEELPASSDSRSGRGGEGRWYRGDRDPKSRGLAAYTGQPVTTGGGLAMPCRASGAGGGQGGREPLALRGDTGPADGAGPTFRHRVEEALVGKAVRLTSIVPSYPRREGEAEERALSYNDLQKIAPLDMLRHTFAVKYGGELPEEIETLFNEVMREVSL